MNKFIVPPDSLMSMAGCVFWFLFLAVGFTVFLTTLLALVT